MDQQRRDEELTERLQRELRSCLENFHSISRSADPILIVDREGIIRYANPAADDLFGRDTGEVVGQIFGFPVIDGERTEIEIVHQGQSPVVAEMRTAQTDWGGESAWLATLRDVTERKELERGLQLALEQSEEARNEIDAIVRSVAEGLIVIDRENRIVLMNHSSETMLGMTCQQVAGLPVDQVFREEPARSRVIDALAEERGERFDLEMWGPPSGHRILQGRTAVIRNQAGKEGGSILTLQDVTRMREIERMKSEFVSIAAHDLRSPLTSIIGFSELLLNEVAMKPEDHRRVIQIIRQQALFMVDLADNFLDVTRIESGEGISLKRTSSNVEEMVDQVASYIQMNSDKFVFQIDLDRKDAGLLIDCKRMGQVLLNILGNAVKYSPEGNVIRIEGRPSGGWYQLSVIDQGIGMKPDQVERIFDKFYRADTSPLAPRGIGLGMSIVKDLVEAHEGKIWVESELGKGTAVRFVLPSWEEKKA